MNHLHATGRYQPSSLSQMEMTEEAKTVFIHGTTGTTGGMIIVFERIISFVKHVPRLAPAVTTMCPTPAARQSRETPTAAQI